MANKIRYQVEYNVQQNSLNQLKSSLQQIKKINISDVMKINNSDISSARDALKSVQQDATKVESALSKAFNAKLNTINIQTFNKELASSNLTIEQVYKSFSRAGTAGQSAFNNLSSQILNTNLKLRQSNKLLDSMAVSMANTVKWGITSSIFNNMTRSIQSAYYYAKDLDRSLTDIRIVTGDSADQMERFAQAANNTAKDLGRSTLDYTKTALSFYQQGLSSEQVQAKTQTTLKAENITGIGAEMSDYLTAVWNGFNVGAQDAELYVDKLAAVADSTASNMGQLATAISKVASAANNVGVDVDQLNGQIATVIATTRQAPQTVGVAFKTIYARINDIKAGTDQAEVSLGNYSGKMAELGFNVLDATGHLRDTGEVIEEIGGRWDSLTRQQQINLAQTMAGQRQYNNLIALFDNWDKYLQSVNTSLGAQGTLNQKNDRYLESLEAHMMELGTQAERTYDILFDTNTVKGFVDLLDGVLVKFNDFIKMFGSGAGALTNLGLVAANVFNKQISNGIDKTITSFEKKILNIQNIKGTNDHLKQNAEKREEADTYSEQAVLDGERQRLQIKKKILQLSGSLTQEEYKELESLKNKIAQETTLTETIKNRQAIAEEVLNIGNATDSQILQEIKARQNELNIHKQRLNFIKEIVQESSKNIDGQEAVFKLEGNRLINLQNMLSNYGEIAQYQDVINKLTTGQVLEEKDINLLTEKITKQIEKQSEQMITIEQLKRAILLVQKGEASSIEEALAADKQRTVEIQKQAQRRQLINNIVSKGTAIIHSMQTMIAGINQATSQTATGAEKANGYWQATTGALAGVANYLVPGSGLLVQGISSIIQSLVKGTDVYKSWEESLKSIEERINDLKEQQEQALKTSTTYTADKSQIENLSKEFDELSEKAGNYGQKLSTMTEEQQARYHELVEQIISKNPDLVAGYNSQGQAIIANNDAIKDTLNYLDQQYQKQMAILYAKQNVANAEKILKEKNQAATDAASNEYLTNPAKVVQERYNTKESYKKSSLDLVSSTKEVVAEYLADGLPISENQQTIFGQLSEVLNRLKNTQDDDIVQDFIVYVNDYKTKISKVGVTAQQIQQAQEIFYNDLLNLKNNKINNLSSSDFVSDATVKEIKDLFDNYILSVDQIQTQLNLAEQKINGIVAKANSENQTSNAELQAALISYKNYLFGALRYDPTYNTEFEIIRNEWKDNFTPQIESLLESITQNWVNTIIDSDYTKYVQEQDMTQAVVNDYNNFIKNIFEKINPEDLTTANTEISKLMQKSEELSAKEFTDQFKRIFVNFVNSDTLQQIIKEDLAQHGNLDLTNMLLQSIFGEHVKITADEQGNITKIYENTFRRIINNVGKNSQDMSRKFLEEAGYSQEQLEALATQIQKQGLYFDDWFRLQQYAKAFFKQTGDDFEQGANRLSEGFDKVNKAVEKVQAGKDLSYKDKLNLIQYLGLSPQQVEYADVILEKFKQQINSLEGLDRFEALSKVFTDFNTLKEHFQDFGIKEFGDEYNALWQNIFDSELEAIGINEQALESYAKARGMAFETDAQKQDVTNLYKRQEQWNNLGKTVEQAKDKLSKYTSEQQAVKDTQALGYLQQLQQTLHNLGLDVDYQWIIDNLIKIGQAAQGDLPPVDKLENYIKSMSNVESISTIEQYQQDKTSLNNLKGASKSLTDKSQMSQDQIKALEQILSTNQELNRLAQTQGINSEIFLLKLNEILSTKQQQLEISRQQALLENQQEIKRTKAALEATDNFGKQLVTGQQRNKLQLKLNELTQQRLGLLQQIGKQEQQHTLDADVKQDEYQNLTNYVRATADANEDFANSLEQDVEGAEQVSEALLRYKAALQDVSKNYDDWIKKLNSGDTVQQAEAVGDLANAYGDLLDLPSDAFSDEFIKDADNLQLLQDAVNNVDGAYDELMEKAHQEILTQVGLDDSAFQSELSVLEGQIANGLDDIEAGAFIDDTQAIQAMNQLINMADMTATEAQALLGSMGVEAEVEQAKIPKSGKDQFVNADAQVSYEEVNSPIVVPFLGALGSTKVQVPSITYSGDKTVVPKEGEETVTALRVKTARKSSGGGIKRRNIPAPSSSGNKGGKGGGGKGGKGKGGGGGKGAQPDKSKKDPKKLLEDQRDIYHDINIQLDQINRTLERVQKQQDRLYGKTLLDNLTKQQDLLDKHKDTLNSKLQLQKQDLAHQKEALKNLGVTFDQYGNISNYMSILGQKQVQINNLIREENALIAAYNKETNKEAKQAIADQITQKEKQTKSAQDDFKSLQDKIKNYDKLLNDDMQDVIDQIEEQTQKQIELEIQKFRMEVQIRLDMGQAERDWNKFVNNVLNRPDLMKGSEFDNILGNAGQSFNDLFSYFDVHGSKGTIETLTDQLLQTKKQIEDIDEKGKSAIYGDNKAEAMKHLQDDLKELMDQMEDIEQLIEDIDNAYLDTIEDISDQFDKQIEDYEYVNDLIQHSMDLLTLLYGDKNFDAMNNYYTTLRDNNLKQIDSLKQQRDFWKEQWEAAFAAGDLKAAEKFEEKYKNTINNLNSLIQESAKLLQEKYANAIEGIFDALDNKLSSGKGIDYINTSWDLMNQNNDEYLDTINTAFAIQQTERKYKDALDNTKSIKNQQALNKLMNQQLDILRNKAKVTEYDVERAEKLLQVEQARIALEESQSAKTSMRLKRDSQGNYSYQYVADQNAIDQARENLANAQNELYNFDKDRYKANLDDMIAAWKDFRDQYKDIILDTSLADEQRVEKLALLEQKWGEYINDKTAENAVIRNNLMDSAFTELASMYQTDVANYMQMAEDEKNILMEDLVPAWGSGIQQMTDKFAGEGGFIPTCEQAFDSIIDTTQDYKDQLDDLAETAQIDLNDVANGVNNLSNQFQDLIMDNNELINTMTIEMTSIASLRAEAQLLAAEYNAVYQAAKAATTAIHNFIQMQQQAAAGAQSTNNSSSGSRSNSSYSGSSSSSSSNGGSGSSSSGTKSGSSGGGGGGSGSGSGGSNSGSSGVGSSTSSSSSGSSRGIYVDSNWMQRKKKNYTGSNRTSSYSTGGYTGDWGSDEGKLAILHEKELVLNQKDTKNFLQGINILRQISDNLNGNVYSMLGGLVSGRNSNNALNGDSIEQDVHIDANFPNVNSKKEIEEALSDLVNLAAQRVMRRS